jgi:dihydrofolate reductase
VKPLALVVAMAPNQGIGLRGTLPWHVAEDLKRFKALTMGHAIVMGRKTHESIGRPLPGRRNVVVSRQLTRADGCEVVSSLSAALDLMVDDPMPFIIGGAQLYAEALPKVTHLFLTELSAEAATTAGKPLEVDTFFPAFDRGAFDEVRRVAGATPGVTFVDLVRAR